MNLMEKYSQKMKGIEETNITQKSERKWKVQDVPGIQCLLRKDWLNIDMRPPRAEKVLQMAHNWSWIACGVITVTLRNNDYYVIDGNLRVAAALKNKDISFLPCMVFAEAWMNQLKNKPEKRGKKRRKEVKSA